MEEGRLLQGCKGKASVDGMGWESECGFGRKWERPGTTGSDFSERAGQGRAGQGSWHFLVVCNRLHNGRATNARTINWK